MKKVYATLTMALVAGSMLAMTPKALREMTPQTLGEKIQSFQKFEMKLDTKRMNRPAKAPSSINDLCTSYEWIGIGATTNENSYLGFTNGDMVMYPTGNGNEVNVYGINLVSPDPIKAEIDLKNMTISFPSRQYLAYLPQYNANVYFMHYQWNETGDGMIPLDSPLVGTIYDNGVIEFPFDEMFGVWMPDYFNGQDDSGAGFLLEYANTLVPRPSELTLDGWYGHGNAHVENLWLDPVLNFYGVTPKPYDVQYRAKTIHEFNEVLGENEDHLIISLMNPYGPGTPYENLYGADGVKEANLSLCPGTIDFNIVYPKQEYLEAYGLTWWPENEAFVSVERAYLELVGEYADGTPMYGLFGNYSGFMGTDAAYYVGDVDGYAMVLGEGSFSIYDIMQEYPNEVSTYNNGVVQIGQPLIGQSFFINTPYASLFDDFDITAATVTLDLSGVEGIHVDNSNAPVKYYNLQGVEVANPAKGQIVIKKQGNQTSKFIAK